MIFVVIFFFKQNTAYEMRISDWSSDVCSSDLKAQEKAAANQGLTVAKVRKYLGVARLLAPVLLPIAYRAATAVRAQLDTTRAQKMGIAVDQLRSEERRVGKECVSTCRSRVSQ